MKNLTVIFSILFIVLSANSQYIDTAFWNTNTNPPSIEIHGNLPYSGWPVTHIDHYISDTVYVGIFYKECSSFTVPNFIDTLIFDSNFSTLAPEIVVYMILDTNTIDTVNCLPNFTFDTTFRYTTFQSNVGLQENTVSSAITLFPNPAKDLVQISGLALNEISQIRLFDLSGRLIRNFPLHNLVLSLSGVEKGEYFILLQTDFGTLTEKLVIH